MVTAAYATATSRALHGKALFPNPCGGDPRGKAVAVTEALRVALAAATYSRCYAGEDGTATARVVGIAVSVQRARGVGSTARRRGWPPE